ncbi:replication factor-a protein [Dentipellis sp. KUC8613]|nr:replication factor-a protein [Dentipellis sp. KUC8613]
MLTDGICHRLQFDDKDDVELWSSTPVVQILSVRQVPSPSSNTSRYRLIISDGAFFLQSMLATQLNHLVEEGVVVKNSIIRVERMSCNYIQGKRLVVILGLETVQKEAEKIGDPKPIPGDKTPSAEGSTAPEEARTTPAPAAQASTSTAPAPVAAPVAAAPQQRRSGNTRSNIFPIEGLSPYQNNWVIKARVMRKSDIRTYSNQRGEGKLFDVTLMDETGEIKATGFNAVVDALYDKLQEDRVYYISKARVNLAKKKFTTVNNEYELSLERNTEIEECLDTENVPTVKYSFVSLSGLEDLPKDSICDVIGIVKEVGDVGEIMTKTSRTLTKRELTIVDQSGFSVRVTLWGKQAEQYQGFDQPVVAFKGVKVGDFGGRSLSVLGSSIMTINPDISEAHQLRGWYDDAGAKASFHSHSTGGGMSGSSATINRSEMRTLNDVKESQLGMSDKPEYFSCRATIMHIKPDNLWYPACPTDGCNKKVIQQGDSWRCEKCDKSYDHPEYRYIISMAVADYSGQAWLQGFNDVGVVIFGMTANELHKIREADEAHFNAIMQKAQCNAYNYACRAKQDTFNDQTRVRYGISRIQPLNYVEEARSYIDLLRSPWAQ